MCDFSFFRSGSFGRPNPPPHLAEDLARFPQRCLRADRHSCLTQWSLDLSTALAQETRGGREVIRSGETREGAARFVDGSGRHGSFGD